jgi:uncharacterized protein
MDVLTAPHVLEYPYERSTGPVIGAFLTALRERRVVGIRGRDGRVLVPPQEYDPDTSDPLEEVVAVSDTGTLVSWSWNPEPRPGQPLDRPFAWALVRLDGADTPMLHVLAVDDPGEITAGMRVRIRWAEQTRGAITDIAAFEPGEGAGVTAGGAETEPVTSVATPIRLDYTYTAGPVATGFLRGTQERRLLGRRCSSCAKVYLPPRGVCSMCGAAFTEEIVEVAQVGTVATFAVVNVNFASREVELPYAAVEVRFDGADTTAQFLIQGCPLDEVRMGMRVRAVWKDGELEPTLSNVTHVEPVDEPDAPFESYQEHV